MTEDKARKLVEAFLSRIRKLVDRSYSRYISDWAMSGPDDEHGYRYDKRLLLKIKFNFFTGMYIPSGIYISIAHDLDSHNKPAGDVELGLCDCDAGRGRHLKLGSGHLAESGIEPYLMRQIHGLVKLMRQAEGLARDKP